MKMYSAPRWTEYGYRTQSAEELEHSKNPNQNNIGHGKSAHFTYNMQENMLYGRYCESGIGVIIENKRMMCVEIDEIRSNYDDYEKR